MTEFCGSSGLEPSHLRARVLEEGRGERRLCTCEFSVGQFTPSLLPTSRSGPCELSELVNILQSKEWNPETDPRSPLRGGLRSGSP